MHRHADLLQRVYRCNFEMETGVLHDDFAEPIHEVVDPGGSIDPCQVSDSGDGNLSDGGDSVLEVVEDERLEVLHEKVVVLHLHCQISDVSGELKTDSPLGVFRAGLKRRVEGVDGVCAHNFDEFDSCFDAALSDFLVVVLHEVLDQGLHVLVCLVLADRAHHVLDDSSHIGCITKELHLTMAKGSLPKPMT